jgi:hypothetical protein
MFIYHVYLSMAVLNDELYWKIFDWLFCMNLESDVSLRLFAFPIL